MPWGYRKVSAYRPPSSSAFQRKGETMSLNNALVRYSLTREQVDNAEIECQWRSCHGNPYAVVKCSDMAALKERLEKQAEEEKEKALIEKHGVEGLAKMRREEEERKEAQAVAREAAYERNRIKDNIANKLTELFQVSEGVLSDSLDGLQLPKTKAKSEWHLNDSDLRSLPSEKVGRSVKYNISDLVVQAEEKHGGYGNRVENVLEKISATTCRQQYARYLKDKLDEEMSKHPQDLVDEACEQAKASLEKDAKASEANVLAIEAQVVAAKQELEKKQNRCRSFDLISFSGMVGDENAAPAASPTKKQKVATTGDEA